MASAQKLVAMPTLTDLLGDPARISTLPREAVADLRGQLARLDTLLLSRLLGGGEGNGGNTPEGDRLLTVSEAAAKLGLPKDALYRNEYPFQVRVGSRRRFSEKGIEKFIRNHTGM